MITRRELIAAGVLAPILLLFKPVIPIEPKPEPVNQIIFPTGFPTLDKALNGGLRPGENMVVMGRRS